MWTSDNIRPVAATSLEQLFGMTWYYEDANADMTTGDMTPNMPNQLSPFSIDVPARAGEYHVWNNGIPYRRPASDHPDAFNAVFAGGNAKALNNQIAYSVYLKLMTPNGAKSTWTHDPSVDLNLQRLQAVKPLVRRRFLNRYRTRHFDINRTSPVHLARGFFVWRAVYLPVAGITSKQTSRSFPRT